MNLLLLQATLASDAPGVLALCAAMTLVLLWYIFTVPQEVSQAPEKTRLMYLRERKEVVYDNLRDLNFEYKAGKFPESDYRQMRASLEDEAATLLAEIDRLESSSASSVTSASSALKSLGNEELKSFSGNGKRATGNEQKGRHK